MANCVIYGNVAPADPQLVDLEGANTAVNYCNVQDGWAGLEGDVRAVATHFGPCP